MKSAEVCRGGGIGIRAGLRSLCPQGLVGSSPTLGKLRRINPSEGIVCFCRSSSVAERFLGKKEVGSPILPSG